MPAKRAPQSSEGSQPPLIPQNIENQLIASSVMLPVKDLFVDPLYQRPEDASRVSKMSQAWNWLACRTLTVSLRQSKGNQNAYAVIDGQQRLATIRKMGYTEAPCTVYLDLTPIQEAELYEILNTAKKPGYNDLFKSRLAREENIARYINTAVEQVGYHLDPERKRSSNPGYPGGHAYLQSMSILEAIYDAGGSLLIIETLRLYKDIFWGEHVGKQAWILGGLARFVTDYKEYDRAELINKVKKAGEEKLVQHAYQWQALHGRTGSRNLSICEAFVTIYNERKQEANRIRSKNI